MEDDAVRKKLNEEYFAFKSKKANSRLVQLSVSNMTVKYRFLIIVISTAKKNHFKNHADEETT